MKKVLLYTSGYRYKKTDGTNVGDVSQFENAILLLRKHIPRVAITAVAHSLSNECVADDIPLSRALSEYIWGDATKSITNRMAILARTAILLMNARRLSKGLPSVMLTSRGKEVLEEFRKADFLFYAGAGALSRRYMLGPGYIWLLGMFLAQRLGIPYVLLGQQIGPLDGWFSKALFRAALKRASFIGVRDHGSLELLGALGIAGPNVIYTGDEGFYLPPGDLEAADRYLADRGIPSDYIAVQFRLDSNSPFGDYVDRFAALYSETARRLGKTLVFVPFSYASQGDDRESHRRIASHVDVPHFLLDLGELGGSAQLTKAILSRAALAVGVANHFCAFAASVGVPTVGIHGTPYMSQKLDGLKHGRPYVLSASVTRLQDINGFAQEIVEHARAYVDMPRVDYYDHRPAGYEAWLEFIPSAHA